MSEKTCSNSYMNSVKIGNQGGQLLMHNMHRQPRGATDMHNGGATDMHRYTNYLLHDSVTDSDIQVIHQVLNPLD